MNNLVVTRKVQEAYEQLQSEAGDMVKVNLKRIGLMPTPIEVEVLYEGGAEENFYIPLQMMRAEKPLTKEITL